MIWIINAPEIPANARSQDIVWNVLEKREKLWFIDVDATIDTKEIIDAVAQMQDDFTTMVVLWIGGSALWTRAVFEWLMWKNHNEKSWVKKLYILDSIESDTISDLLEILDIEKTIFCVISKSGTTIETQSQYIFFRKQVQWLTSDWKKHFCFVVWENFKYKVQLESDFRVFELADNIGGRFSVFTAVWLVPLAFVWIDIDEMIAWVSSVKNSCLSEDASNNIALTLALMQYYYYKEEQKNICVFFPYSSRLAQIGEWYKQLLAESIWKDGVWVTPCSAIGVTDQHSQLQLYQDGPQDKLFLTLEISHSHNTLFIDKKESLTFDTLMKIEKFGTESSLINEWIPVISLAMDELNERNIAQLLYIFEFQIAYLWELFVIDAFNQPWVEKSKIITKQKLQSDFPDLDLMKEAFCL